MTPDFARRIMDWRGTNGIVSLDYASLGYADKNAPFETVDELRLVYGATEDLLAGDDLNRNGVLDANEKDLNGNGQLDSGLFEYTTVYTREPNFHSDGSSLTNVNTPRQALPVAVAECRHQQRQPRHGPTLPTGIGGEVGPTLAGPVWISPPLQKSGMSSADFAKFCDDVTTSTNTYFRGRVNVNTASADVLTALFMGLTNVEHRRIGRGADAHHLSPAKSGNLNSIAWVIDALGNTSPVSRRWRAAITSPRKAFNSPPTSRRSGRSGAATGA
jgi:hypothetical protein